MSRNFPALSTKSLLLAALLAVLPMAPIVAAELPLATTSPLTGFTFDDRPLVLPVQQNFQMAMLTASSELGRSCGKMEAYGWRMSQSEQGRVDQIFSSTVDRMRGLGYSIEAQAPSSVSHDITMFTADKQDKHFLFMWSAGEIGLVMTLCETTPPIGGTHAKAATGPAAQPFMSDVVQSKLEEEAYPRQSRKSGGLASPVGSWVGDYSCSLTYYGATMTINHLYRDRFDGTFRFYPTKKNPHAPEGSYAIYGQYDKDSGRILINPGNWINHPHGTVSTVMVGSFDGVRRTVSATFQGVTGCTSFEAKAAATPAGKAKLKNERHSGKSTAKKKKKAAKKTDAQSKKDAQPKSGDAPIIVPPTDTAPIPSSVPAPATPANSSDAKPTTPAATPADTAPQITPPSTVPNQTGAPLQGVSPTPQTPAPKQSATPTPQTAPTALTVPPPSPLPATDSGNANGIALPSSH